MPVVDPMPLPGAACRFGAPLLAHDASYLAASAKMANFRSSSILLLYTGTEKIAIIYREFMQENTRSVGGCACGKVRFLVQGEPRRVGLCHCLTCRKAHGAAFFPYAVYAAAEVQIIGETHGWSAEGTYIRRFCPQCGSRVAAFIDDEVELSLGSFDEPQNLSPQYEIWVVHREHWLPALPVPQYRGNHE